MSNQIPATREAAIDAMVELDVAKWGERERAAAKILREREYPTYGLALNGLAHRPEYDYGDSRPDLVAAAKRALTAGDWADLQQGGR